MEDTSPSMRLRNAHHRANWFFLRPSRTAAPWAFKKGEPFRTIAPLELLGSLLGLLLDGEEKADTRNTAKLSVSGLPTTQATDMPWHGCSPRNGR